MQYFLNTVLLVSTAALAFAAPLAPVSFHEEPANSTANVAQSCSEAAILADGIALNIMDQKNEQSALAAVKAALSTTPVDMADFTAAKANLLSFVNKGIAVRQMNQQITPTGNPATEGLAIVANAQLAELQLSTNLTGDPKVDLPVVATLEGDFSGGIVQNQKNQAAAMANCKNTSTTTGGGAAAPAAPEAPAPTTSAKASKTSKPAGTKATSAPPKADSGDKAKPTTTGAAAAGDKGGKDANADKTKPTATPAAGAADKGDK